MKRIIFYSDSPGFGGAEKVLISLIKNLDRDKYGPYIVFKKDRSMSDAVKKAGNIGSKQVSRIFGAIEFFFILKYLKPDIVDFNMHYPFSCIGGVLAAKLAGARCLVARLHSTVKLSSRFPFGRSFKIFFTNIMFRQINLFISVSQSSKNDIAFNYGIDPQKVKIVRNGIEPGEITGMDKVAAKRKFGIDPNKKVVGLLSRLVKDKGHYYFIDSADLICRSVPDVIFLIA